jgi:hypothetical protein
VLPSLLDRPAQPLGVLECLLELRLFHLFLNSGLSLVEGLLIPCFQLYSVLELGRIVRIDVVGGLLRPLRHGKLILALEVPIHKGVRAVVHIDLPF